MRHDPAAKGPMITVAGDRRITKVGKFLRQYKADELPQLFNVLKGEMSFVGPRPEVKEYVQLFKKEYKTLLRIRPGITDPASIKYSDEERVLSSAENWEEEYKKRILPGKIDLSLQYVEQHNIMTDFRIILTTLLKAGRHKSPQLPSRT
jgi:lipopolysaccharide/colanic/teichoic acid biosynthesis glycosyltransferase